MSRLETWMPRRSGGPSYADERGAALILALTATALLTALGGALVTLTTTETMIAARHRDGLQAFYAAEAALERALGELRTTADWEAVATGTEGPAFLEGSLHEVVPGADERVRLSVVVWVSPADEGMVTVRARAYGPLGVSRTLEATAARSEAGIRVLSWRERR